MLRVFVLVVLLAGCMVPPAAHSSTPTPSIPSTIPVATSTSRLPPSSPSAPSSAPTTPPSPGPASSSPANPGVVTWHLAANGSWVPSSTPPPCPEPLVLATPVDLANVSSILYPGQVRGNAFKLHGGFRFDNNLDNNVTVRIPFDTLLMRGTNALRNGTDIDSTNDLEEQDGFEFIAPCGIMYTFGHLRRLAPRFQAIADSLPLVVGFNKTQYYSVDPPVMVHTGEVLATAVGFEASDNVFLDWGVLDLRHDNGKTLRPEWAAYADGFDRHGVCWLDLLSPADSATAHALPGGSGEAGKESDYC